MRVRLARAVLFYCCCPPLVQLESDLVTDIRVPPGDVRVVGIGPGPKDLPGLVQVVALAIRRTQSASMAGSSAI